MNTPDLSPISARVPSQDAGILIGEPSRVSPPSSGQVEQFIRTAPDGGDKFFVVLPTTYNGIKFRSRTEARWAVFMDALGIKYVYEHEGYKLGEFFYLPDFWLPDHGFFVEIKPRRPTKDEEAKASLLAEFTKKDVFIFCDTPRQPHPGDGGHYSESAYAFFAAGDADIQWWWCECQYCGKFDVQFNGRAGRMHCCARAEGDKDYQHDTAKLNAAYELAERYEFWNPKGGAK